MNVNHDTKIPPSPNCPPKNDGNIGVGVKTEKQKIFFVITKSVWGGAQKYIADLASGLDKNMFEVFIAAGGSGPLKDVVQKSGAVYLEIPHFARDISPLADLFSFFEIAYIIWKLKPHVLHVNSSKAGGVCGAAGFVYRAMGHKLRMVFTVHGWAFNEPRGRFQLFWIRFFSRPTSLFYQKIICVSEFDFSSAIKFNIAPRKKLITIHNGIAAIEFFSKEEARKKLGLPENAIIIGTLAEWTKNKGLDILIKSVAKLLSVNSNSKLFLIGSGENSEKETIFRLVKDLRIVDKAILKEFIPSAANYLNAFDIFVLPSRKEGLSYTLMEASLAQLPIVATNVGGNPEIIENEKTGLLVPAENETELSNKIQKLLENPDLAKKLGAQAKVKVEKDFSIQDMRKKTYSLYI